MLMVFFLRQQVGYLVLAAAFFVVNIFTLIGFEMQKRNVLKVYEKGLSYRKVTVRWTEIAAVDADSKTGFSITKIGGDKIEIPGSIDGVGKVASFVRQHSVQ